MELSLTGKFLERFKYALDGVVYDYEEEGGDFFLEFDGQLKIYSNDWVYLDIDETEMDLSKLGKTFKKKLKPEYLKELKKELEVDNNRLEIIISVGEDIVYMYLIDHYRPSAYDQNIIYSYYIH